MRVSTTSEQPRPTPGGRARRALGSLAVASTLILGLAPDVSAAPTPTITIGDVTVVEGNAGTTNAVFTIQVAPAPKPCCSLQVGWSAAAGTALAPADYTTSSGTVTLSRSTPSRTVVVPVVGDAVDEANETFVVNLSNLVGSPGTIGDAQGVGTITDDDGPPALSVNDVTVPEGHAGTTTATFTISLSAASGQAVTVNWATTAGTATAGTDYVAASGSRTIAAGSTTATVGIVVNGDIQAESNETFGIALSTPANATIGDGSGTGTITDDDASSVVSAGDVTVTEGNAGTTTATFTISLSPASSGAVTVDWATTAGTATAGTDYVAASGSRTIAAGSTTATVGITVNGDALDEDDETFGIALSNPANATIGDGSGAGTITDDDPLPVASVDDATVSEGDAGAKIATFTIALSAASSRTVTVDWATTAGTATAGTDYVAASGSRTIAAGSTTATVGITVNGDALDEDDETFAIALSNPTNATIGDGSGVGTIADDDPLPALSISDDSVTEGDAGTQTMTFAVILSAQSSRTVTVQWATADAVAVGPSDYAAAGGTLTFSPGQTSKSVNAIVNGDLVAEIDEPFLVELSAPTNATIGDGEAVGTIVDDELLPVIDIDAPSVTEGNAGTTSLTFTISLSHPSAAPVTVDWATAPGTATVGTDFLSGGGTVTFASLETSKTISVTVNGDGLYEADESVVVALSNATNAPIGRPQRNGFIANDDVAPGVSVSDRSVTEGDAGTTILRFTLSTTFVSGADATVDFATSDGTASAGSDYAAASGTVTIPAGSTSRTVDVTVQGDSVVEPDETLLLVLSEPTHVTLGDAAALGTIENDDRLATSITLQVRKTTRTISAKGVLEPTAEGHRVTITLLKKQGTKFVKATAKTVGIKSIKDRDGDGRNDGAYSVSFARPSAGSTYKVMANFKGRATYAPSSRSKRFRLPAS
jgi:hypothetical protein